MSNAHFAGCSNYVKVKDIEGLKKSISRFSFLDLFQNKEKWCILQRYYDEPIFSTALIYEGDDDEYSEEYLDFDPTEHVIPYLEDNEVFIIVSVGNDKLRSIWGCSVAYRGKEVLKVDLDDIYKKIEDTWKTDTYEVV